MHTTVLEHQLAITEVTRSFTIRVLAKVLSDEHVLHMKLRNYHWNVEGERERDLHALFAGQGRAIEGHIGEIAERMRILGAKAVGTMTEYLQKSTLREHPGRSLAAKEMLQDALEAHREVIRFLREAILSPADESLDVGSADLLKRLLQDHGKMAWALRATLSDDLTGSRMKREDRICVLYE